MFSFMKFRPATRRRVSVSSRIAHSVSALESRELLSGANAPVETVVDQVSSHVDAQSKITPLNFAGTYHVNGNATYVLTLVQQGHAVSGTLTGGPALTSMAIKGRIVLGTSLKIHFKGLYGGQTLRLSFDQNSVTYTSHTAIAFSGDLIQKVGGKPVVLENLAAIRV